MSDTANKTSPFLIFIAWLVVSIPLAWGLYRSVLNSRPLFLSAAHAAPAVPAANPK
jgi:hypothetical protein